MAVAFQGKLLVTKFRAVSLSITLSEAAAGLITKVVMALMAGCAVVLVAAVRAMALLLLAQRVTVAQAVSAEQR